MSSSLLHHPSHGFFFMFLFIFSMSPKLTTSYKLLGPDDNSRRYKQIPLPNNVTGPESIAFDCRGRGPYVGVADGRILKWRGARSGWSEYAVTSPTRDRKVCDGSTDTNMEHKCGRPLGLKFDNRTCELYIADAYFGLLRVRRGGLVTEQLAASYDGVPFKLTNSVDIDTTTGEVYFTDSSRFYQRREFAIAIMLGDKSGRVMKYDPRLNKVTVLLRDLSFPNGLALSKDNSFLFIAETGRAQLLRLWLSGPRAGTTEMFTKFGRYPDNIKRNDKGEFWVGIFSGRGRLKKSWDQASSDKADNEIPWSGKDPVAIKYGPDGTVMEVMDGKYKKEFESISEVVEFGRALWIGSGLVPFVVKFSF